MKIFNISTQKLAMALAIATIAVGSAACGGGSKGTPRGTGLGKGDKVPPPPDVKGGGGNTDTPTYSKDARKDFEAAAAYFSEQDKNGWSEASCRGAAEKFESVAREHKIADAQYMVGRSYHACNLMKDAEAAYQAALAINSKHAPSIANLGELYWQVGKKADAKKYWQTAVEADPKTVAARANLAMVLLEEMKEATGANWDKLEKQARDHLSSVLAVDNEHLRAYVLYGLVYLEGRQKNRNRLDLAKLLLDEAKKRNENFAPLQHAYGLYYLAKSNLTEALASFSKAVELDAKHVEARTNVGLITLGFRKYDVAKDNFTKVLELTGGKSYDALIGLGVAQRGLGDLDGAEGSYKKAKELEPKRGEAYFNLGVLYKDFIAAKQSDLRASQKAYGTAKEFFKDFLSKSGISDSDKEEAKNNIEDCDKVIKSLEDFIKASAQQPAADAGGGGGQ